MKRLITLLLFGLFVLSLGACGSGSGSDGDDGPKYYTVTFHGVYDVLHVRTVQGGTAIGDKMPPDAVSLNATFKGWYTEPDGHGRKVDANFVITGDLDVYVEYFAPVGGGDIKC